MRWVDYVRGERTGRTGNAPATCGAAVRKRDRRHNVWRNMLAGFLALQMEVGVCVWNRGDVRWVGLALSTVGQIRLRGRKEGRCQVHAGVLDSHALSTSKQ